MIFIGDKFAQTTM